jgi:hypothetical protein
MKKFATRLALTALLLGVTGFSTASRADTGEVAVVFTKGGFSSAWVVARASCCFTARDIPSLSPA